MKGVGRLESIPRRFWSVAFIGSVVIVVIGCGSDSSSPPPPSSDNSQSVHSITVTPQTSSVQLNQTQQFTATAQDASGNTIAGITYSWNSSDPAIAAISSSGVATGIAIGATDITASIGQVKSSPSTLSVTTATVSSLTVTPSSSSIQVGQAQQFTATAKDAGENTVPGIAFTWNSSNPAVASVSNAGSAVGLAIGTTSITATGGGLTSSEILLSVTQATVRSIAVTPSSSSIKVGESQQFVGTAKEISGATIPGISFTWNSSNSAVAGIQSTGLATSLAPGTTTITASANGVTSSGVQLSVTIVRDPTADLQDLTVSVGALSPAFAPSTLSYAVTTGFSTQTTSVTAIVADDTATMTVNGVQTISGQPSAPIPIGVGTTTIAVVVSATNGQKKRYEVTITRAGTSDLSGLQTSAGPIAPPFDPAALNYTAFTPFNTDHATITVITADSTATVTINSQPTIAGQASMPFNLTVGSNLFTIVVSAPSVQSKTYSLTINRSPAPTTLPRATVERSDDLVGYQVKIVYALPSDGIDNALDTNGTLVRSVGAFQRWLEAESGGKRLRLDTYQGALDVLFFRMSQSDAAIRAAGAFVRDEIEKEIRASSFFDPKKIYAVYYDGSSTFACGGAAWPPNTPGNVVALYLQGTPPGSPPCASNPFASSDTQPGYLEFAMIHEIFHGLGAVATCAPNQVLRGHVSDDPEDLMYAGAEPWRPSKLDTNRDDYFAHGTTCLDVAKSVFVTPTLPGAVPPPGL